MQFCSLEVTYFIMCPNVFFFSANCNIGTINVIGGYSHTNFCQENTWDQKRWWSSFTSFPMIVKAYHIEH